MSAASRAARRDRRGRHAVGVDLRPRRRALHLVDIENLAGTGRVTVDAAARCLASYRELGIVGPADLVVVGCNPGARLSVGRTWRGARCVSRAGSDGADLALLAVLDEERTSERFTRFVLASGDHAFAGAAERLSGDGAEVTVVARPLSLSGALRRTPRLTVVSFPDLVVVA